MHADSPKRDKMLTKSQLKDILSQHTLRPLKRLGENYLIDGNIKDKIIEEARIGKNDIMLEIGAGLGALTIDLAMSGAKVYAVEKDKKIFSILKENLKNDFPNLELFCEDILKFDLRKISAPKKIKVIGNLPYYITTPIVEYLITNRRLIQSILIMVQREVANRLLASPGTKDYSSISCFVQYHAEPAYIYTVKRTSFYPEPGVDSSLIRLDILDKPSVDVKDEELFFRIIRGSFNEKRKSIINSLSREAVLNMSKEKLSKILISIGINPATRPETLGLSDFATISNALAA